MKMLHNNIKSHFETRDVTTLLTINYIRKAF